MGMGNANIAATYFALLLLPMLSTDDDARGAFAGVDRIKTLRWLRRLQRSGDGSFGEVVYEISPCPAGREGRGAGWEGDKVVVGGGKDMRYCYLAATIRWILRGEGEEDTARGEEGYVEDIDVDALVAHIRRSQTYDGGFSESYRHESHAGYAYCAVAALALLDRPLERGKVAEGQTPCHKKSQALQKGIGDIPGFISFLVSRQFVYLEPTRENAGKDYYEDDEEEDPDSANFLLANLSLAECTEAAKHVGFNGRCNKVADTCYTWWVLGSLSVLGVLDNGGDGDHPSLANNDNNTVDPIAIKAQREFLLEKTQHAIGGFGKRPGDPPDIYHSSLGLAALATLGYPGLKKFDSGLCVSVDTVRKIEKGRRGLIEMGRKKESSGGSRVDFGKNLMDMAVSMGGGEGPDWLSV
ncbi:Geranylgeranyl transferase type-1 subunit beta [Cytospora mali]|uniref:Geranylgeranyl transferase type-1 subunit beta n=1 Tax=Cytospora mali TaxID=578113 RepID=A0A194V1G0_CYTMA|nr:Geranylgeranyl transferase type-1 subunit beta [Valsa mali var. pyri (nom. inval.)]